MKHLLAILLTLISFAAATQEMAVRSMDMDPMDLTAATNQRRDLNGVPCAVVKVQMPRGAIFEGNIIGDVEYRAGEYRVYMTANSKMLRVLHESAKPLMVNFAEPLLAKATYILDIAMPSAAPTAATQQKVEIKYSPADAIVLIDGQIVNATGGIATTMLPADRDYNFTVTGRGYIAQQGTFHLHPAVPTRLNIELSPDPTASTQHSMHAILIETDADQPPRSESEILAEANKEYNNKNYAQALELYKQIPNNPRAQALLGYLYDKGLGVSQNYAEAINWYRKAAEQGNATAQCNLGVMYYNGQGVSQNYVEALRWFRNGAEQGNPYSQSWVGHCYYYGKGVSIDKQEAYKWFKKAADQGHEYATKFINEHPDINQPQRTESEILAEANKEYDNKNYAQALELYKQAPGQASVKNRIGYMYNRGQGVSQNYAEAVNWYRKAAEQGFAPAQNNLGIMYEYGRGVPQDYTQAAAWYRKAAEQGNATGQANLGECCYTGHGVPKNTQEAYRWLKLAADQGNEYAIKFINGHTF